MKFSTSKSIGVSGLSSPGVALLLLFSRIELSLLQLLVSLVNGILT